MSEREPQEARGGCVTQISIVSKSEDDELLFFRLGEKVKMVARRVNV